MHEMGLAADIIKMVARAAEKHGISLADVTSVKISVGMLTQVVPESLKYALGIAGAGAGLVNAGYVIRHCPVNIVCGDCGVSYSPEVFELVCAACGSKNVSTAGGREMRLDSIDFNEKTP